MAWGYCSSFGIGAQTWRESWFELFSGLSLLHTGGVELAAFRRGQRAKNPIAS